MSKPNFTNRTLFHGDNLDFLRGLNSESVDLIATDPPFNKGRDFHATPESLANGASFQDRWSWEDDVEQAWVDQIKDDAPQLMEAIESAKHAHSDGMGAFMCFLAVRLMAMHRVLKPTGSIFLHCDPTASHYIKAVMDAIFGPENFRNEIIWHYYQGKSPAKDLRRKYDTILRYAKSKDFYFDPPRYEHMESQHYLFKNVDEDGRRYRTNGLKDKQGNLKRYYLDDGIQADDVWTYLREKSMVAVQKQSKESTGYPTQKPLGLYRRIIESSSKPGDVVLDPFCGCATTCVAAEQTGRQWIGMDLWKKAVEVVCNRVKEECDHLEGGKVTYTQNVPTRTDDRKTAAPRLASKDKFKLAEPGKKMSRKEMLDILLKMQGCQCQGCDREFDRPEYLQLDHNTPRSQGGLNHISNRLLLCGPCNLRKSNTLTLEGLRRRNKKESFMADQS